MSGKMPSCDRLFESHPDAAHGAHIVSLIGACGRCTRWSSISVGSGSRHTLGLVDELLHALYSQVIAADSPARLVEQGLMSLNDFCSDLTAVYLPHAWYTCRQRPRTSIMCLLARRCLLPACSSKAPKFMSPCPSTSTPPARAFPTASSSPRSCVQHQGARAQ